MEKLFSHGLSFDGRYIPKFGIKVAPLYRVLETLINPLQSNTHDIFQLKDTKLSLRRILETVISYGIIERRGYPGSQISLKTC